MLKISFELLDFDEVELVPISDVHIGNQLCNIQALHDIIEYINEEPANPNCARICLLNGDLTESVTRKSLGDPFNMTMTPSVQVATMIQMLKPLSEPREHYPNGKILSYCGGNHDVARYKDTGITAAENIAVGLGLEDRYSENGCYSFIKLKKHQCSTQNYIVTIYNSHMTGGSSTVGGKANRVTKLGLNGGIVADVCIGSHVHQAIAFKEDYLIPHSDALIQKTMTYVITGSFLRYGDYAQRMGMKPSSFVIPKIYIRQLRDSKTCSRFINTEVLL